MPFLFPVSTYDFHKKNAFRAAPAAEGSPAVVRTATAAASVRTAGAMVLRMDVIASEPFHDKRHHRLAAGIAGMHIYAYKAQHIPHYQKAGQSFYDILFPHQLANIIKPR